MRKLFIFVALAAAVVPAAFTIYVVGGWDNWQGVLPKGTTDSLYYYARIKEVADGYPLNGNPYVYEYREENAPAFFIPDIISALPMLAGIPFNLGLLINVFLWSLIFLWLSFKLLTFLRLPVRWAALWSIISLISAYSFMLRPTIMQLIYPALLLFLLVFARFLEEPQNKKRALLLAAVSAASFYLYTYLAYIAVFSLAFVFMRYLAARKFPELKSLLTIAAASFLLLIPFGLYTWAQMAGPYYFETLERIGLIYTRAPMPEAFLYARWVVIGLAAVWLLPLRQKLFWFSTGLALLASLYLNIITGVELQLGTHIGRFVILWAALISGLITYEIYVSKPKKVWAALLGLLLLIGVGRNALRSFDFFKFDQRGEKTAAVQAYATPLNWLEENIAEESVVWANDSLSQYIPIMTKHYPLFFHGAKLHNVPNEELAERELVGPSDTVGLRKFNASYLILDRTRDDAKAIDLNKALYDDGRFAILSVVHDKAN